MSDRPISADRLKSFIHRVEKLVEERKAIQGDIRDVFAEAKGVGYNVKIMRKVVALRAMDASDREEQESLIDTYMHALEQIDRVEARVAAGESIRKAADAEGMPKSTAIRHVTQNRRNIENGSSEEDGAGRLQAEADTAQTASSTTINAAEPASAQTPPSPEHAPSVAVADEIDLTIPHFLDRRKGVSA